jgi:hypothetical protein
MSPPAHLTSRDPLHGAASRPGSPVYPQNPVPGVGLAVRTVQDGGREPGDERLREDTLAFG